MRRLGTPEQISPCPFLGTGRHGLGLQIIFPGDIYAVQLRFSPIRSNLIPPNLLVLTSGRNRKTSRDELRAEYDFDYSQSRPNRFASRMGENVVAVVLEADVAQVFDSSDSVNRLLRSVISVLPRRGRRVRATRRKAG